MKSYLIQPTNKNTTVEGMRNKIGVVQYPSLLNLGDEYMGSLGFLLICMFKIFQYRKLKRKPAL